MRQIAELTGVSAMTVSRALKDNPRISAATRKRIRRVAEDLGYAPHPYVSALMSGLRRTRLEEPKVNLAVFYFGERAGIVKHTFYQGIVARAQSIGYAVESVRYDDPATTPARLRDILLSRGIRGIVLMPAPDGFASIDFNFDGFAAATLGHTIVHPPLPRVANDTYSVAFRTLDELRDRGYRRIGLIINDYVNRLARFLYSAAILAYRAHVAPQLHLVEHIMADPAGEPASMNKLIRWIRTEKLDAVICPLFGIPIYELLIKNGIRIPQDVAYIHLLDYPDPDVTSMRQMGRMMGGKAVDLVIAMINRNEFTPPQYPQVVGTLNQWHEGRTAPPRPSAPRLVG